MYHFPSISEVRIYWSLGCFLLPGLSLLCDHKEKKWGQDTENFWLQRWEELEWHYGDTICSLYKHTERISVGFSSSQWLPHWSTHWGKLPACFWLVWKETIWTQMSCLHVVIVMKDSVFVPVPLYTEPTNIVSLSPKRNPMVFCKTYF